MTFIVLDFKTDVVIAVVLIVVVVLAYRLLNRDSNVRRTRWGFFVERERFDDEPPWPDLRPPEDRKLPEWRDKTAELPPKEEP